MARPFHVIIGLCNPKSPSNVGSVLRAVGCYQASQVHYTGGRFDRAAKFQTDTQNTNYTVPLIRVDDLSADTNNGFELVCVEFAEGAVALPEFRHPERALYVFGPEDGSIDQPLIDRADHVVYVPTVGSMNLAASVNVLLYDRLAKSKPTYTDAIVKASRDTNNRLKVKLPPA